MRLCGRVGTLCQEEEPRNPGGYADKDRQLVSERSQHERQKKEEHNIRHLGQRHFLSGILPVEFSKILIHIHEVEVFLPDDKKEQQAIAAVLSSLDNKIELLREQNKTLESIAQAIFKEWFVDFEFPIPLLRG